jgi:hypothetical protein
LRGRRTGELPKLEQEKKATDGLVYPGETRSAQEAARHARSGYAPMVSRRQRRVRYRNRNGVRSNWGGQDCGEGATGAVAHARENGSADRGASQHFFWFRRALCLAQCAEVVVSQSVSRDTKRLGRWLGSAAKCRVEGSKSSDWAWPEVWAATESTLAGQTGDVEPCG